MAFETQAASSPNDLLDKVRLFLVANGWTQNGWAAVGSGYRLHIQKGNQYVNLRSATNEQPLDSNTAGYGIAAYGSDGYDGGLAWSAQPGASSIVPSPYTVVGVGFNIKSTGVLAYYIFANGDYCHLITKITNPYGGELKYTYLSFGKLNCFEPDMDKGYYLLGQRSSAYMCYRINEGYTTFYYHDYLPGGGGTGQDGPLFLRVNQPNLVVPVQGWCSRGTVWPYGKENNLHKRVVICNVGEPSLGTEIDHLRNTTTNFYRSMKNTFNSLSVTFPMTIYLYDAIDASGGWIPIGTIPGMFYTRVDSFTPGDRYTFGGLNYRPFPWSRIDIANNFIDGCTCVE
uniref:Putative structural protein n=1 Tax=viral metagenome TaxID=1070528 RepID=A0A6M3L521_9ZZZZ